MGCHSLFDLGTILSVHFINIFCFRDVTADFVLLVLQTAAKEIELSDQLGTAVVSIAKEIGRWEAYLQLYSASPRIHSTIAELFAQVINFSVRAMKLYEMPASCIEPLGKCVTIDLADTNE